MTFVTPSLNVLTQDQIRQIHNHSLEILTTTGIRVDSPKALKLFGKFSCRIEDNHQVFINSSLSQ